ncbi:hypothetical protein EV191_109126 [Tamaricihabitans halophyticus]|uniref:Uncharacterized protein n=1 Tax=Tamaricihabitans halophyticus TaxID=1262583 RepID=A0A4R2QKL8_9PSEU|nr:hypothetical protein [Tamaricihabitans halophyticus]TCP49304.1 hypothetical protein EV191_109126 [Tamaricihabitans halophyticus]
MAADQYPTAQPDGESLVDARHEPRTCLEVWSWSAAARAAEDEDTELEPHILRGRE